MQCSSAFWANVLLATTAFARPSSSERYAARVARRAARAAGSPFINKVASAPVESSESGGLSNSSHVEYSTNWAGCVIESPPSGSTWKTVTGTFVVPTASGTTGSAAAAWVGIDGDSCQTAILQTGVDFTVGGGYDAWYEWYPEYSSDFSLAISAGDTIKTTVTATSTKKGTATVQNVTKGKTATITLTDSAALCLENAEWIVEDFDENDQQVAFANFGTVAFTGAVATANSGTTEGPSSGVVLDIKQSSKVLTSCSCGSSTATCSYV